MLSCERLESDQEKDIDHGHLDWNLIKRLLGNWRWYGCSLLVSSIRGRYNALSEYVPKQFAISGETESFGSNNLMGQWLKAVGGYTVEQIGACPLDRQCGAQC